MKKRILILAVCLTALRLDAREVSILVYPFENTGDPYFNWVSAGMTATAVSDLARVRDISVISEQDRKKALKELESAQSGLFGPEKQLQLAKLLGADLIFTGNYLVINGQIRVNAHIMNVQSAKTENARKFDGTLLKIFELQDQIVIGLLTDSQKITIANLTPVQVTEQFRQQIENKPAVDPRAFELYSRAR